VGFGPGHCGRYRIWGLIVSCLGFLFIWLISQNSLVIVIFGEMVAKDGEPAAVGEELHVFGGDLERRRPMG
jgi:hypothetical protein